MREALAVSVLDAFPNHFHKSRVLGCFIRDPGPGKVRQLTFSMDQAQLNWLTNFIWNIADDVLRDVYVRGK